MGLKDLGLIGKVLDLKHATRPSLSFDMRDGEKSTFVGGSHIKKTKSLETRLLSMLKSSKISNFATFCVCVDTSPIYECFLFSKRIFLITINHVVSFITLGPQDAIALTL